MTRTSRLRPAAIAALVFTTIAVTCPANALADSSSTPARQLR